MASYGYTQPKLGASLGPRVKPLTPGVSLARAASAGAPTSADPFGLGGGHERPGSPLVVPFGSPQQSPKLPPSQSPTATPPPVGGQTAQQPVTPQQNVYDVNVDPALQSVNAYTGLSDAQAQAQADKQRRDQLLQYGDEQLVQQLLGDSTLAKAAGANPTSTLKTLGHQKDQGLHDLLASLIAPGHNLGYSGFRVKQEQNLGNEYQNALAQAASGLNSGLDSINANLGGALGQNAQARAQAESEAYGRQLAWILAHPPGGDGSGSGNSVAPTSRLDGLRQFLQQQPPPPTSPRGAGLFPR